MSGELERVLDMARAWLYPRVGDAYEDHMASLADLILEAEARACERCARIVEKYYRTVPYDLGVERQIVIRDLAASIRAAARAAKGGA